MPKVFLLAEIAAVFAAQSVSAGGFTSRTYYTTPPNKLCFYRVRGDQFLRGAAFEWDGKTSRKGQYGQQIRVKVLDEGGRSDWVTASNVTCVNRSKVKETEINSIINK